MGLTHFGADGELDAAILILEHGESMRGHLEGDLLNVPKEELLEF